MPSRNRKKIPEIAIVDDLEKCEKEVLEALLHLPNGSPCRLVINSGGGSVYAGLGMATVIEMKHLKATAVVLADCSSSALMPFASCRERLVAPHASFLFHPMQWSSEERSRLPGAIGWAREFKRIEEECGAWLLSRLGIPKNVLSRWIRRETYVTAGELVELGVASYIPELESGVQPIVAPARKRKSRETGRKPRTRLVPAARKKRSS